MQKNDFKKFSVIMVGMAENYGQSLTAEGVSLRFKLLAKYSIEEVEHAAIAILTTRKYTTMPTIADFLEYLGGGSHEDKAEVEAGKVLNAITDYGPYASVAFDNPVTQAVIANAYGGWPNLCASVGVEETVNWFRKNFAKTWAAYSRQGLARTGHLPGLVEISNSSNGFLDQIPKPALVGDKTKAKAVLEAGNLTKDLPVNIGACLPVIVKDKESVS